MGAYESARRARTLADTKTFWNILQTWKHFVAPLVGLAIGAITKMWHGVDVPTAVLTGLLSAVCFYAVAWLGTYLINYIWLTPAALYEEQQRANRLLQEENATLKIKPYDVSVAAVVRSKLQQATGGAKALLKFLLEHGETEQSRLTIPGIRNDARPELLRECQDLGLIKERPEIIPSFGRYTYWRLVENFAAPLRDLLYTSQG